MPEHARTEVTTLREGIAGVKAISKSWRALDRRLYGIRGFITAVSKQSPAWWQEMLCVIGGIRDRLRLLPAVDAMSPNRLAASTQILSNAHAALEEALKLLELNCRLRLRVLARRARPSSEGNANVRYHQARTAARRTLRRLARLDAVTLYHASLRQAFLEIHTVGADSRRSTLAAALVQLYKAESEVHKRLNSPASFLVLDIWIDPGAWDSRMAELELITASTAELRSILETSFCISSRDERSYELALNFLSSLSAQANKLWQICAWEGGRASGKRGYSFRAAERELRSYLDMRMRSSELLERLKTEAENG